MKTSALDSLHEPSALPQQVGWGSESQAQSVSESNLDLRDGCRGLLPAADSSMPAVRPVTGLCWTCPSHLFTLALLLQYRTLSWNTDPSSRSRLLHWPSLSGLNLSPTSQPFWPSQTIVSCDLVALFLLPELGSLPTLVNPGLSVAGPSSSSLALSSPGSLLWLAPSIYRHYLMLNLSRHSLHCHCVPVFLTHYMGDTLGLSQDWA